MPDSTDRNIEDKLKEAHSGQQRFVWTRGIIRLLIWLLTLILTDLFIDWVILRGNAGSAFGPLLLIINIAILGYVAWNELIRHLKDYDELITALDVEERHPDLSSLLVSYTQLKHSSDGQANVSKELIAAMRDQAVEKSHSLDFRKIVDFGQLKNLAVVSIGIVSFFGLISFKWQTHVNTLFQRLAGVDASYPTNTDITGVDYQNIVKFGDSINVTATWDKKPPEDAFIFTRAFDNEEAKWKSLPMVKTENVQKSFTREIKGLTGDLSFYVQINDDESDVYRVNVIKSPEIQKSTITLKYPDYMKRESLEIDQLTFEAPEGTTVSWQLQCDSAVKNLEIINAEDGKSIKEATISGENSNLLSFDMKADNAINYSFRWTEGISANFGEAKDFIYDDVQHSIRVVSDSIPKVELLRPSSDGLATVAKKISIAGRASDDHGLGQAWLVYQIDGSADIRKPIMDFEGKKSGNIQLTWDISEDIKELKPGIRISYALEVKDLYPSPEGGVPHLRRSIAREIEVVEPERYLQWYRSELAAQNDELKRARESELTASSQVKQLREQEDESQ
ncbi:MAG: hypothetical protein GY899_15605 [Verrucomicrobiaceae bacterium]|nr:hypothetical protein [Verrucomicrobiaceae bacterium]